MDPVKILKRAWHILWSYRTLWVFGLILALAGAGSSGGGGNSGYQFGGNEQQNNQPVNPQELPQTFRQAMDEIQRAFHEGAGTVGITQQQWSAIVWIVVAAIVFFLLIGIVVAIARYVAETAAMRMVDEYENSETKMTLGQGFKIGWSRTSWRLFLINLIVNLPLIVFLVVILIAGIVIYNLAASSNQAASAVGIISMIGMVFLALFVAVILSILLRLLRQFFWRVCALEGAGVMESLQRGFALVRENWKSVGLMWLVMIGVGIVWVFGAFLLILFSLPIVAITFIIGLIVAAIPALILGSLVSLFVSGWIPWVAGVLFALPLFFVIAFSPWILLGAWQTVFTSTVWTLTYRELKAVPAAPLQPVVPAAA